MKTHTVDDLLARLGTNYGPPITDDFEALVDEYRSALGAFSPDVIQHAADYAIRNNAKPFWPPVGAFYAAAKSKQDQIDAESRAKAELAEALRLRAERQKRPELTPEAQAMWERLYQETKDRLAAVSKDEPQLGPNWVKGQRTAFEDMMRNSQNQGLYRADRGTK